MKKLSLLIMALSTILMGCGDDKSSSSSGKCSCSDGEICATVKGAEACHQPCSKEIVACEDSNGRGSLKKTACIADDNGTMIVGETTTVQCSEGVSCNADKTDCASGESDSGKEKEEQAKKDAEEKTKLCKKENSEDPLCDTGLECRIVSKDNAHAAICVKSGSTCTSVGVVMDCEENNGEAVISTISCYAGAGADAGKNYSVTSENKCGEYTECKEENEEVSCDYKYSKELIQEKKDMCAQLTCSNGQACRIVEDGNQNKRAICANANACTESSSVCTKSDQGADAVQKSVCVKGAGIDEGRSYTEVILEPCTTGSACSEVGGSASCVDQAVAEKNRLCSEIECKGKSECHIVWDDENSVEKPACTIEDDWGECDPVVDNDEIYSCLNAELWATAVCKEGRGADAGSNFWVVDNIPVNCTDNSNVCSYNIDGDPSCVSKDDLCLAEDGETICESDYTCMLVESYDMAMPQCVKDPSQNCETVKEDESCTEVNGVSAVYYDYCQKGVGPDAGRNYIYQETRECDIGLMCTEEKKTCWAW